MRKNASSKEQPSDSSTDNDTSEDGGSSSSSALFFLALFLFILGARPRREMRQEESPVDTNEEVDLDGIED